jgi:hypothetical protein
VKPGFSVVVRDEFTEMAQVHFNVLRIVSGRARIDLIKEDGVVSFPTGRYRLASIKRQLCAEHYGGHYGDSESDA